MSNKSVSPTLDENFAGTIDIMLGRSTGLKRIDLSKGGFFWSFSALLITGFVDMASLSLLFNGFSEQQQLAVSKFYFVFGKLLVAMMGYLASLTLLFLLCRTPSEKRNFPTCVIVHNWASTVVSVAFLPLIFLSVIVGPETPENSNGMLTLISLLWLGLLVLAGLRIIRISLDIPWSKTGWYFASTALVSLVLAEGLEKMMGLSPLS